MIPYLDGEQLLEDLDSLNQIGLSPKGGLNRIAYSPADVAGRAWVNDQMEKLGLQVYTDTAGNNFGRYSGQDESLPPLVIGSHTDTVPEGGRYDGALGVLSALACVRALHEAQIHLHHPVEIANFACEEATVRGGTIGSKALVGLLEAGFVEQAAGDGRLVREHLSGAGLDPYLIKQAQRSSGSIAAFLELHIEQGRQLETAQIPIGVVEGIVGIRRFRVIFNGYANHAGTTLMSDRQDALIMAAPFILAVRDLAMAKGVVGTVGTVYVAPNAPNVIPGRVDLSCEIRGLDEAILDDLETALKQKANALGGDFTPISYTNAVKSDPQLVDILISACEDLALPYQRMSSGAGHDAMNIAHIAPQAMIFVPSHKGVSHSADEYTDPESCVAGARILLAALMKLDEVL